MPKKPLHHEIIDPEDLAKKIYTGQVSPTSLPHNVYYYNAEKLKSGLYEGYKKDLVSIEYNSPDYKMLNSLRENIYMFSGAKTFQQVQEMSAALTEGDRILPYNEFKAKVEEISDRYNGEEPGQYLWTEWNTAIDSGRQASWWVKSQENKEALPNMTYHTDGQDTVCEICGGCDGVTLTKDDPFWDENFPPQHFNCHCYTSEEEPDADLTDQDDVDDLQEQINETDKQPMFKQNVGKSGEMFNQEHPYFIVPPKYKDFAEQNFGLPVPNEGAESLKSLPNAQELNEEKWRC